MTYDPAIADYIKDAHEDLARRDAENERLRVMLKECADRFERCCRTAGNDAETAAAAVQRYRASEPQ